jgi:RNA polymerase sigma factor (sigma-70 family)
VTGPSPLFIPVRKGQIKMTKRDMELQLVGEILRGADVTENMERLYMSLRPVFHNAIQKYGRECEREDLMQEMYLALSTAVEQYRDPETRARYTFHQVLASNANHKISAYLLYHYRQYIDENGKVRAYRTHCGATSLNVKAWDAEDAPDIQDILPGDADIEEEYMWRETEEEQREAAVVLWAEVDKLQPLQRSAIVDYYRLGISHAEKAEALGEKRGTVTGRAQRGLEKLRENPRIQEIAPVFIPSLAYRGGMGFFKRNGTSSTEYVALNNIEREERGAMSTYRLVSPSFFDGKTSAVISRYTGVSPGVIQKLRNGAGGVYKTTAEQIARFYNRPFDEIFEICVERAAPKGNPAKGWKIPKSFRLADPSFLNGYNRSQINREKAAGLNTSIDAVDAAVRGLRGGGRANTKTAERISLIFGVPFDQLFVPV